VLEDGIIMGKRTVIVVEVLRMEVQRGSGLQNQKPRDGGSELHGCGRSTPLV